MKNLHGFYLIFALWLVVDSCTIYKKELDNPVDHKANDEQGIGAPTLVFYPKSQTKSLSDSVLIESFIVFKPDSMEPFAGVHLQIEFPNSFLELDTIKPGPFITDTSKATPLFTYSYDGENIIDIYTFFIDTVKYNIQGTGHIADLVFTPFNTGTDSIRYNLKFCEMIDYNDNIIDLNGDRAAEVIIQ
jgi:hypothetical protein